MRKNPFITGSFYHVYAHTISDLALFRNEWDYKRFLCTFFAANGDGAVLRLDRQNDLNPIWGIRDRTVDIGKPLVDIVCFCLMNTHFHLLLGERGDGNISKFMQKLMISYAKYLNLKYERRGHVFESRFHSKLLDDNEYFLRASCYIHLNPKDARGWKNIEYKYPWSSYQDYLGDSRWGRLLKEETILSQFKTKLAYREFVREARPELSDYAEHVVFLN